ncbi:amino acid adenylation domain-containing protein [Xenophilus aerolatus]|nr:amino acid adenylation domain-containing protein [Xenophilus aerolatus]
MVISVAPPISLEDTVATIGLGDCLRRCCGAEPDQLAYAFLDGQGRVVSRVSRRELVQQVERLAVWLMRTTRHGDRLLLAMPPGLDFVRAFWACLLAGRVAVPIPAPDAVRLRHALPRIQGILEDCRGSKVLTTAELQQAAAAAMEGTSAAGVPWEALPDPHALDDAPEGAAWPEPSDVAYLQYTSGSTGVPRGVCLSHANVLANVQALSRAGGFVAGSRMLNWLPQFHDYGLVCGVLLPVLSGGCSHLMSPLSFVRRPLLWLQLVEALGITHTGAPDSALRLCLSALGDGTAPSFRLDSLVSLSCGAEPIRAETVEALLEALQPAGLRPEAFMPFYGMAESVLGVSGPSRPSAPRIFDVDAAHLRAGRVAPSTGAPAQRLVGCGQALGESLCLVVDPDRRVELPAGEVGELWVRGPSVGLGYWRQPEATEATFGARLANGRGPFLRTGDLGAVHQGQIVVTGRLKDLIIIQGANHYPQDLEWAAEQAHAQLRVGHSAAFAVDTEWGEGAVLVLELERRHREPDTDAIFESVRRAVAREHGVALQALALVRAGTLARTSSGKIQRSRAREAYLAGTLDWIGHTRLEADAAEAKLAADEAGAVERTAPRDATESAIHALWAQVLGHGAFGVLDDFFELGGNSLRMTQVFSRIRDRFGAQPPLGEVFELGTVAAQAAWVAQWQAEQGAGTPDAAPPMAKVPRGADLPASLSQRRMWIIQRFEPDSTGYNVPIALHLRGALDRSLCQGAVDAMVRRHEGLRTALVAEAAEPMQRILPALSVPVEWIDLAALPLAARLEKARAVIAERAVHVFDLAQAPLHRFTVVRLAPQEHVLVWVAHHAITDNWAVSLLMRELLAAYEALRAGRVPHGTPPAIQYGDYAAWQRSAQAIEARHAHLAYWRERLQGLPDLDLPTDFVRPALASHRGARVSAALPQRLREAAARFGGRASASPFVLYLSVFSALLSRIAGSGDIGVGVPIANRQRTEAEALVGTLVNTLVLRTDLSGDPSFEALVKRVRGEAMAAFAHQEAPYDEVIDALGHDRTDRPEGPVRVLFNVLNAPVGDLSFTELQIEEFGFARRAVQFDLSMHIDTEFSHRVHLDYASDLYTEATASRLLDSFLSLAERLLLRPAQALSTHELASPAQIAQLHAWNGARAALPAETVVPRYLALDDAAIASREAVVDAGGRSYSFADIDGLSNALARRLRERGIARGARVGLCIGRSPQMLLAQLGVLKAGAAYVPLDPAYPLERLRMMAEDAGLALALSGEEGEGIVDGLGVPSQRVDDWLQATGGPGAPARAPLPPDAALDAGEHDEAYLIYTSGSTGRPKGVMVPHRGVVNFLEGMLREPGLTPGDCLVAVTSPSFDPSVLDLLLPLRARARLVIASWAQTQDATALRALLESSGATLLQATPSAWRQLLEAGWQGGPHFRGLIGGEALPPVLAEQLTARMAELWNIYGPTETTVWTTAWRVHDPRQGIAIGRPIANTTVWALDPHGHPCPIGVPGELYVGGEGVTAGYLGRPELNAERFLPDPFGDRPGARMYRSGDLGRWRHDGQLEHLGRADHQVKLRGHRIELGEIESALLDHPALAHCVAVTRALSEADVRLVAYYVRHEGSPASAADLREHLRARLPDYMVPQHFVALDRLPQLPNGKVNRAALPALEPENLVAEAREASPLQTPQEETVAAVWRELLGVDEIHRDDNFFDLGGHSLLAARAVAMIERELGLRVAPRRLIFESLQQIANPHIAE